ncbi:hypothetical protein [Xanthomonas theicola]|uniref:hypothetical protein n=1 Tax=Xanthomonas theicola TaxID=56464 RepID=UPI000FF88D6F|nr:hypothetical protein [Xanthomonas theicola]QNH24605.1 hypothetical protein G4Q83_07405 [Xanthomonas theicola]
MSQADLPPIDSRESVSAAEDKASSDDNFVAQISKKNQISVSITSNFKKGMSYGNLRGIALINGWIPKLHPSCKQEVIGAAFEKICSSNPKRCEVCDLAPELSECSGDGYCIMEFDGADGRQLLTVITYGEIDDVLVSGEKSRLQVSSWKVKSVK